MLTNLKVDFTLQAWGPSKGRQVKQNVAIPSELSQLSSSSSSSGGC